MLKKIIIAIVIVVVLLGMAFTVPSQDAHREALKDTMAKVASQVAQEKTSGVPRLLKSIGLGNEEKTQRGYDRVGQAMAPALVQMVYVNDYVLFSLGKMDYEGTSYPISLGIFGHVFTLPLDKIEKAMAEE